MPSAASSSSESAISAIAEDPFLAYCTATNAARVRVVIWLTFLVMLVVGPAEYYLLGNRPEVAAWQRTWMVTAFVMVTIGAAGLQLIPFLQRHAAVGAGIFAGVTMGVAAAGVSHIGGLETLYTGIALVTPMMASFLLVPLYHRVWLAAITPIAFLGVLFAMRPESLHYPYAGVPVFHATLSVIVAIVFGHMAYILSRENFAQRGLLASEADRLAAAVSGKTAEVLELARNLVSLEETERTRIARELHDELGQQLTAARLEAGAAASATRAALGNDAPAVQRATGIEARLAIAQQTVKEVVFSLRPPALDDFDLRTALGILVDRYRRPKTLDIAFENALDGVPLTDTQATTVFRVLQEALTNVTRHANAANVRVRLATQDSQVELVVADDGHGLQASRGIGFGLRGMRERLRLLGGEVNLEPGASGGAVLRAAFPLTTTTRD